MRVLCCIGQRSGPELVRRVAQVVGGSPELLLLRVIDTRRRDDLAHLATPLGHGPRGGPHREQEIEAAEAAAAQAALDEALQTAEEVGLQAGVAIERGKPEQVIVRVAEQVSTTLIAIRARERPEAHPRLGPPSVGHTARFVLDHAPCDVLLLREVHFTF